MTSDRTLAFLLGPGRHPSPQLNAQSVGELCQRDSAVTLTNGVSHVRRRIDGAREPTERAAFLAASCGDDTSLPIEVEALLAADGKASGFLQCNRSEFRQCEWPALFS